MVPPGPACVSQAGPIQSGSNDAGRSAAAPASSHTLSQTAGSNHVLGSSDNDGLLLSTHHPGQLEQQQPGSQATVDNLKVLLIAVTDSNLKLASVMKVHSCPRSPHSQISIHRQMQQL